jgi:Tfp pilus assembly protein PilN
VKIYLDYAHSKDAPPLWVWALLISSLLLAGAASWQYFCLEAEGAALQQRMQSHMIERHVPIIEAQSKEDQAALREQLRQANAVLSELGRPWPALFSLLEEKASAQIALLALRPDAAKGRVRIAGEARDLIALLHYVHSLSQSGLLTDVVLEQHEVVESDAEKPVRFTLAARWNN